MWSTVILSCASLATFVVGQISDGLPPLNAVSPEADNERRPGRGNGNGVGRALGLGATGGIGRPSGNPNALPVVDMGHRVQQATEFNVRRP